MNPSPFQVARETATNFANAGRRVRDENAIESILSSAMQTGDPQVVQNSIGKILSQVSPERQGQALSFLQNTYANLQSRQEREQRRQAATRTGLDPDLPEALQKVQFENQLLDRRAQNIMGTGNRNLPVQGEGQVTSAQQGLIDLRKLSKEQLVALSGVPGYSTMAQQQLKVIEAEEKEARKDSREDRKEIIEFHKESQKYDDELLSKVKVAKNQIDTVNDIEKALASGNVNPGSLTNIFKGMGPIGNKIAEAVLNKDQATLLASIPALLEGWKDVFGVRLSDADLALLQEKLPSIGKNKESNRAITKILRKYADMNLLRGEIASQIKQENKGLRPLNYGFMIEQRFDNMIKPVKVVNPNTGRVIEIPAYKVGDAVRAGATIVDE